MAFYFLLSMILLNNFLYLFSQLSKSNSLLKLLDFSYISQITSLIIQLNLPQQVHLSACCSTPFSIPIKEAGFSGSSDFAPNICSHIPAFLGSTFSRLFSSFCDVDNGSQQLHSGPWQVLWLKSTWISGTDFQCIINTNCIQLLF